MTMTTEVGAIRVYFDNEVGSGLDLQVRHDNDPRDPPTDESWMRVSINDGETKQIDTGGGANANTHRSRSVMIVSIFSPPGIGDSISRLASELIKTKFRSQTVSNVVFGSPTMRVAGKSGPWWQVNVICPFEYDEIA